MAIEDKFRICPYAPTLVNASCPTWWCNQCDFNPQEHQRRLAKIHRGEFHEREVNIYDESGKLYRTVKTKSLNADRIARAQDLLRKARG